MNVLYALTASKKPAVPDKSSGLPELIVQILPVKLRQQPPPGRGRLLS